MKRFKFMLPVFLLAFFYSCKSVEKQRRHAQEFYQAHPAELADQCSEKYPPRIEYRKGQDILLPGDTVIIKGDSVECPEIPATPTTPAVPGKKIKCPDSRLITDTIIRVDTNYIENTARVNSLQYRLQTVGADLAETKNKLATVQQAAKVRMWWIVALILAIAAGVILRVKKVI